MLSKRKTFTKHENAQSPAHQVLKSMYCGDQIKKKWNMQVQMWSFNHEAVFITCALHIRFPGYGSKTTSGLGPDFGC